MVGLLSLGKLSHQNLLQSTLSIDEIFARLTAAQRRAAGHGLLDTRSRYVQAFSNRLRTRPRLASASASELPCASGPASSSIWQARSRCTAMPTASLSVAPAVAIPCLGSSTALRAPSASAR